MARRQRSRKSPNRAVSPVPSMTDEVHKTVVAGDRLIVGLGNPGQVYAETRHNLGFKVVARLARRWKTALGRLECNALVGEATEVLLAAPQTYMNRSGYAVRCLVEGRGVEPADILVVFDDVNLPLGRLRLRPGGGPGGHRGMESIVQNLQTEEIPRLRLGIAPEETEMSSDELVEFVLSVFDTDERETVELLIERAADACESWLQEGTEATMNRFNG